MRTAILGGILLVLLAIATDRQGALPQLPRLALMPAEMPVASAPAEPIDIAPAKPMHKPVEVAQPVTREEVTKEVEEEVAAIAPPAPTPPLAATPAVAPVAPAAEPVAQVAAVAPIAPALPVSQPGAPLRLLPPVMEPAVAAPAPMTEVPEVAVPTRPLFKPVDELPRGAKVAQMPELPVAPAPLSQDIVQVQTAQAPVGEAPVKFMSREERSRELYRLAREMEGTFMDKLAR